MPWKPLSRELYKALRTFAEEALGFLSKVPLKDPVDFRIITRVRSGVSSMTFYKERIPSWDRLLIEHKTTFQGMASFNIVHKMLAANDKVVSHANLMYHRGNGQPLTTHDLETYFEDDVIRPLFLNYLDFSLEAVFDVNRFNVIYSYLEEWLLTDHHTLHTIAPLYAFKGPGVNVPVTDGVRIRPVNDGDLDKIANIFGMPTPWNEQPDSLLELETKTPKQEGAGSDRSLEVLEKVITALRLTKAGGVHCKKVFTRRMHDTLRMSHRDLPSPASTTAYEMSSVSDVESFRKMWELLKESDISDIEFAIRRFNFGFERWRIEDRITDYVIGLESLYVPGSNTGETSYKFRMRGAALLGRNRTSEERKKVWDTLQLAYDYRSDLVHSGKKGKKIRDKLKEAGFDRFEKFANQIEGYLRESIVAFIKEKEIRPAKAMDDIVLMLGATEKDK